MGTTADRNQSSENDVDIVYLVWICNHNNGADKQLIGIFTDAIKAKTCIEDFNKKDKFKDNNDNPKYLKQIIYARQ